MSPYLAWILYSLDLICGDENFLLLCLYNSINKFVRPIYKHAHEHEQDARDGINSRVEAEAVKQHLAYRFGFDEIVFGLLGGWCGSGCLLRLFLQIMMLMVLMMGLRYGAQRMLHVHSCFHISMTWIRILCAWSGGGECVTTCGHGEFEALFDVCFGRTFSENPETIKINLFNV